jgi:NAD(P)-dependent dehydrogenase (short-subunit alcohol dehydrogenase family)
MPDLSQRAKLDQAAAAAGVAHKLYVCVLDVTVSSDIASVVGTVAHDYGRIDVLVNNAGFAVSGFAEDIKLEELRLQLETNFFGAVAMTKAVLPMMRKQRSGHIIQMSSMQGCVIIISYAASRHALEGWSESLRLELNALGIKVVLLEPGAFATGIWSEGTRMGEESTKSTSPNFARSLRMREVIQKIPKTNPVTVARAVVAIAQNPNPKLRYLVGRDAKIQLALKRLVPWRTYEKLIANFLKIDRG